MSGGDGWRSSGSDGPRWRELEEPAAPEPADELAGGSSPPGEPSRGSEPPDEGEDREPPRSWVDDASAPPGTLIDGRDRPPGIGDDDGVPRLRLRRWDPYRDLTQENRQFVRDLLRFPVMTAVLVVALCLIYLWMLANGWEFTPLLPSRVGYSLAVAFGALEPERVVAGEWWRLITAALLHGSLLHLAVNCFMLYQLGRLAENLFGRPGLAVILVGSAVAGTTASAFVGGNMSVGASGAVMGLVGACIAFGLRHRRHIPGFLRGLFGTTLYIYAAIILLIGAIPGIDGWGHFGGAVGGALLGLVMPSPMLREGKQAGWVYLPAALAGALTIVSVAMVLPRALGFDREAAAAIEAALAEQRWEDAAAALAEAAAAAPQSPHLLPQRQVLAYSAMTTDHWALACEQLAIVEAQEPRAIHGDPFALNDYAWALFMAHPGDLDRISHGLELSRSSLEDFPEEPVMLNTLAWGLYLSGDHHGALGTIEEAMRLNDGEGLGDDIYVYVASLYASGHREEAVETYRSATAQHPEGVLHAEVRVLINRWEEAGGFDPALATPPPMTPTEEDVSEDGDPATMAPTPRRPRPRHPTNRSTPATRRTRPRAPEPRPTTTLRNGHPPRRPGTDGSVDDRLLVVLVYPVLVLVLELALGCLFVLVRVLFHLGHDGPIAVPGLGRGEVEDLDAEPPGQGALLGIRAPPANLAAHPDLAVAPIPGISGDPDLDDLVEMGRVQKADVQSGHAHVDQPALLLDPHPALFAELHGDDRLDSPRAFLGRVAGTDHGPLRCSRSPPGATMRACAVPSL